LNPENDIVDVKSSCVTVVSPVINELKHSSSNCLTSV
jgi:hypothetical protein